MNIMNDSRRIPEKYGILVAAGLIGFFLLMKLINLHHHVELRMLNLIILGSGVFISLKKYREANNGQLNYFRGLVSGVQTSAIGSLLFGAFLFIYMQGDSALMESIRVNEPMGRHLNPYMASFIVVLEGFFSGFLVTFILLNWVTTDEVNVPQG